MKKQNTEASHVTKYDVLDQIKRGAEEQREKEVIRQTKDQIKRRAEEQREKEMIKQMEKQAPPLKNVFDLTISQLNIEASNKLDLTGESVPDSFNDTSFNDAL